MGFVHVGGHGFGPRMRIERYRLEENGLELLLLVDRVAPVASYQTWFKVGSRHEEEGKTGIAHLFEHLMFGETSTMPLGEHDRRLEEAGAESNAATYLDWTFYLVNLPSEALDVTIELEADRMHNLVLQSEQLESEREVVLNERRQTVDNDVDGSASELLFTHAFVAHGYRFPTIGFADDIAALSLDDCRRFYRTYYAPNNACLVVVGDVDEKHLLEKLATCYRDIPGAPLPEEVQPEEPQQREERRVRVRKPTPSPKLLLGYHAPAMAHADHPPLVLLNEILFGGRASRVHRRLVHELEIASDVSGMVANFRDPGLWEMSLTAREGVPAERLLEGLDEVLAVREAPTANELERARARVELGMLQVLETATGKAEQIGFCETVLGDPAAMFARLDAYANVTLADLQRVCRHLEPAARTVVEVAPLLEDE